MISNTFNYLAIIRSSFYQDDADIDDVIKNERKRIRPKRSSNHVSSGQQQQPADQPSGPVVEFFNPKIRHELEKKDAEFLKRTGLKGAAPGGDAWVWLTSYSRIPVSVSDCSSVRRVYKTTSTCAMSEGKNVVRGVDR